VINGGSLRCYNSRGDGLLARALSGAKARTTSSSDLTSAGMPWSEVPDSPCPYTEWLDGRHGPAKDTLPSVDQFPIPEALLALPVLHSDRPRESKPMADFHGARQRLAGCRPGAWLVSPFTGWRWPNGPMEKLAGFRPIRCCLTSCACDHGTIFSSPSA
jgi:hypothetical protein